MDKDSIYTWEQLLEHIKEDGKSPDSEVRNDAMKDIYNMFMFKWRLWKEPIDKFLNGIVDYADELHITVCLCILMATNPIKTKLDNRVKFYDAVERRVKREYADENEQKSILCNLK